MGQCVDKSRLNNEYYKPQHHNIANIGLLVLWMASGSDSLSFVVLYDFDTKNCAKKITVHTFVSFR